MNYSGMNLSVPKAKVLSRHWEDVKLQKQLSRHFGDREYAKWVVVLPPKMVTQLGWKEGMALMAEIDGKGLWIGPASTRSHSRSKAPGERGSANRQVR